MKLIRKEAKSHLNFHFRFLPLIAIYFFSKINISSDRVIAINLLRALHFSTIPPGASGIFCRW